MTRGRKPPKNTNRYRKTNRKIVENICTHLSTKIDYAVILTVIQKT